MTEFFKRFQESRRTRRINSNLREAEGVAPILEPYPWVRRIIFFGSASRGEDTHYSDLDIAVIYQGSLVIGKAFSQLATELYSTIRQSGFFTVWDIPHHVELTLIEEEEYEQNLRSNQPFSVNVSKGIILFERPE